MLTPCKSCVSLKKLEQFLNFRIFEYCLEGKYMSKEKEIQALVNLLDDSNSEIYDIVKGKLLDWGTEAIESLEETWQKSTDSEYQTRIEEIVHEIQFRDLKQKLSDWKQNEEENLMKGAILLARYQYPDLHEEEVYKNLDLLFKDLKAIDFSKSTPREKIRIVNHVLYDVHKYQQFKNQAKNSAHSPASNYIHLVLENKKGNPLAMSIIYLICCQAVNIPVMGVNLPEHFIIAYLDELENNELKFHDSVKDFQFPQLNQYKDVLFYIDPFAKGSMFTRNEIDDFLKHLKIAKREDFYTPCSNTEMLVRMVNNLIYFYQGMNYHYKVRELTDIRLLLLGD